MKVPRLKKPRPDELRPFKYRIITKRGKYTGSAIHTFYAIDQTTADGYAKAWAQDRGATRLLRIRKEQ